MNKERNSMLEDKITALTKSITTLNESLKGDRLMRLMMIKKQCEDISMPLDCMGLENGSAKEKVECVLEEEHLEGSLTPLETKSVCVETQHEEGMSNELEKVVGVEKSKSLKVSLLSETRRGDAAVGMLSCNCENGVKEFEDHKVDELLGLEVGQVGTMGVVEVQKGLTTKVQGEGLYTSLIPATQDLVFCCDSCITVKTVSHRDEELTECCQYFEDMVDVRSESMKNMLEPNVASYRRWSQWVRAYLKYDLPWFKWLIMVTVGNGVVSRLWRFKAETTGCCLLHSVKSKCISQVFKWLVMKGIDKGETFNLLWSVGDAGMQGISRGRDCKVLVVPWSLLESDRSWGEGVHIFLTIEMPGRDCHVSVFKDVNIRSPTLRGTGHKPSFVTELGTESTDERESFQLQSEAAEFIGKWFNIADLNVKTKGGVKGTMRVYVYSHLKSMNFRIPVAMTGQSFNLNTKISKSIQIICSLKETDGVKLNQIFDAVSVSEAVKGIIAGGRDECKVPHPFHFGKINCKMKIPQSMSNRYHIVLLHLPSKPRRLMLFHAKEIKLVMMLQWGPKVLSIPEFKSGWRKNISTKTGSMRANCVNTIKSVIEWMIAWWGKSMLRGRLSKTQR